MSTEDRRAQGATRIPFEALVEVGGALGPSFEAQAVNISEDGMHLRTAYLPEVGQPITCRFDAGADGTVLVSGDVVWKQDAGKGGEFGIRFTDLDAQSAEALQRMMGVSHEPPPRASAGSRVRLHIEGLGSPMRARVKDSNGGDVTAFSELGFLQVGKHLELEDASTGAKRPAHIDRVEVQIDPTSRVPQLVVKLCYDDAQGRAQMASAHGKETTPEPTVIHEEPEAASAHGDFDSMASMSDQMKGAFARGASKVTPALMDVVKRAKTTMALLAAKRRTAATDDVAAPARRRTSPAPGGGLHAEGRKVVRGESLSDAKAVAAEETRITVSKKKIAIGAAVGAAVLIAAIAMRKPSTTAPAGSTPDTGAAANAAPASAPATPTTAESPSAAPPSVLSPVTPVPGALPSEGVVASANAGSASEADDESADESTGTSGRRSHKKAGHVAPFTNGPVTHGNVLRLKMDGPIEKIEGAAQGTGFTVAIPARRSLEAAGPLASRDSRIASIRVSNEAAGAELSVAFKDGVPNYAVRAKGDTLEIVLASPGPLPDPHAAPSHAAKHTEGPAAVAPKHAHKGHVKPH